MTGKTPDVKMCEHRLRHLVEGLFDVAGNDKDVARVAEIELLVDIDAAVKPVAVVERRDAAHGLRRQTACPAGRSCAESNGAPTKAAS